ncbi:BOLA class I histocompatibility antigen, alpha chain BL3-6-like [Hoplias malabaricus]|uniref:BOLA class I histocompatibility antigen, alpha chain BL3-6-like n=1 Tax=Hoplias malabaricus TaxID=27720 RepID=UPI003462CBF9
MGNKDTENNGLFTWRCLRAQTQWTLSSSTVPHREEKRSPERNRGMKVFLSWSWWVFSLLTPGSTAVVSDKHTLFYLFTVQSEDSTHNIYQFSVETLLDDTQTDSYSSRDCIRTPKQSWMKEIGESEWRTGTEKLKNKEQWVNKVLQLQLEAFRHKASECHVLQWRNGCEGEKLPDGSVSTLNCINEYGYDGEDLMSYNWTSRQWSVSVEEAQETVEKFNSGSGLDPALSCQDCVNWMEIYLQYSPQHTPSEYLETSVPDVYVFVKKSQTESSRLTLTCLATGFYPKDLKMRLRRFTTSLPDHLLTSSGVRPNGDGTYQLRKSVDVQEEDTAGYDCSVSHVSFSEAVITPWDGRCSNCRNNLSPGEIVGVTVGVIVGVTVGVIVAVIGVISLVAVVLIVLRKKGIFVSGQRLAAVDGGDQLVWSGLSRRRIQQTIFHQWATIFSENSDGVSNPTVNGPEGVQLLPPGEAETKGAAHAGESGGAADTGETEGAADFGESGGAAHAGETEGAADFGESGGAADSAETGGAALTGDSGGAALTGDSGGAADTGES